MYKIYYECSDPVTLKLFIHKSSLRNYETTDLKSFDFFMSLNYISVTADKSNW